MGAVIEICYLQFMTGPDAQYAWMKHWAQVGAMHVAAAVKELGADGIVLSTDLGQQGMMTNADGLENMIGAVKSRRRVRRRHRQDDAQEPGAVAGALSEANARRRLCGAQARDRHVHDRIASCKRNPTGVCSMYAIAPRSPFGPSASHPASLPWRPGREGGGAVSSLVFALLALVFSPREIHESRYITYPRRT